MDKAPSLPLNIRVTDTEKRKNGGDGYVAYNIDTKVEEKGASLAIGTYDVWRRFSDFASLRNYLEKTYPAVVLAPLPPKGIMSLSKNDVFIEKRKARLESFLQRLAGHPSLCLDEYFCKFLSSEDWTQVKTGTTLEAIVNTIAPKVKEPNTELMALQQKAKDLKSILSTIIQVNGNIHKKRLEIYQCFGSAGIVFSEWSGIEKDFGNSLQTIGHSLDTLALSINDMVDEEEESFSEPLREYEQLMDSVLSVIRAHMVKQSEVEKQGDFYAAKVRELQELEATGGAPAGGLKGMFKKQTPEQYQQKLTQLRQTVEDEKQKSEQMQQQQENFTQLVFNELAFFHAIKIGDIKDILLHYVKLQLAFYEKQLGEWEKVKTTAVNTIP